MLSIGQGEFSFGAAKIVGPGRDEDPLISIELDVLKVSGGREWMVKGYFSQGRTVRT
jgi:hypothetical protein